MKTKLGLLAATFLAGMCTANATTLYTITDLNSPTGYIPLAINDSGQIVGFITSNTGNFQGYVDNGGTYTTLNVPGATYTEAFSINNNGEIVGTYKANNTVYPFVYNGSSYTTLNVLGADASTATGINNNGVIVGSYFLPTSGQLAYIDNNGTFINLGS